MRPRRRGFLLILSLLLVTIILILGMGLLGSQAPKYGAAVRAADAAQARAMALAGMEDARIKLAKDVQFPPRQDKDRPIDPDHLRQDKFAYSETLRGNPDSQNHLGYTVIVDFKYEREVVVPNVDEPVRYGIYRLTSIGFVGPRADPIAQRSVYAEYDIQTGNFIRFEDRGSF